MAAPGAAQAPDDGIASAWLQFAEPEGFIIGAQLVHETRVGERRIVDGLNGVDARVVGRPLVNFVAEHSEYDPDDRLLEYSITAFLDDETRVSEVVVSGGQARYRMLRDGREIGTGELPLPDDYFVLGFGRSLRQAASQGRRQVTIFDPRGMKLHPAQLESSETDDGGLVVRVKFSSSPLEPVYHFTPAGSLKKVDLPGSRIEPGSRALAVGAIAVHPRSVWSNWVGAEWFGRTLPPLGVRLEGLTAEDEARWRSGAHGPFRGLIRNGVAEGILDLASRPAPTDALPPSSLDDRDRDRLDLVGPFESEMSGSLVALLKLIPADAAAAHPGPAARETHAARLRQVMAAARELGLVGRQERGLGYRPAQGGCFVPAEWLEIVVPVRAPWGPSRAVRLILDPAIGGCFLPPTAYVPVPESAEVVRLQVVRTPTRLAQSPATDRGERRTAVFRFSIKDQTVGHADYEIRPAVAGPFGPEIFYRGAIEIGGDGASTLEARFSGRSRLDGEPITYRIDGQARGRTYSRDCLFMPGRVIVRSEDGNQITRRVLPLPDETVLTDWNNLVHWTLTFAPRTLSIGERYQFTSFRPWDLSLMSWDVTVEETGPVVFEGVQRSAIRVKAQVDDNHVTVWLGLDGGVLRDVEGNGQLVIERIR